MNSTTAKVIAAAALSMSAAHVAHAATPNVGQVFTIESVADAYGVYQSGSYFGMDTNGNSKIALGEKNALTSGNVGFIYGLSTPAGASHGGAIANGDNNDVTAPWFFFSNTGSDFLKTPATCIDAACTQLDFSGWRVTWNGIPEINMGSGAWGGYTDGVANFSWDGNIGSTYTLQYRATVPLGDPSNFGGVQYELYLTGVATAAVVPEAETYAMMLAGLGLVGAMVSRRRKTLA